MICFICNKYISFVYTRWYLCCNALLQIKLDNSILSLSIKIIVFPKTFLLKWKQNIPEQHLFHSSMFSFLALSAILLPLSAQFIKLIPFICLRFFLHYVPYWLQDLRNIPYSLRWNAYWYPIQSSVRFSVPLCWKASIRCPAAYLHYK